MTSEDFPAGARHPGPPYVRVVATMTLVACVAAGVRAIWLSVEQGYRLIPVSANFEAMVRVQDGHALRWVVALAIAVLAPWAWAASRRTPHRSLAWIWGTMLAAVPWAWYGYHYNRHVIAALWRERVSFAGVALPRALTESRPLAHNVLTTLAAVALAALLGLVARPLTRRLLAHAPSGSTRSWRVAGVAMAALLIVPLLLPATFARRRPQGPDIILISLDAVRADHLGCYGYDRPTTPYLDAFSKRSVRFTRAYSQEPWTLTSHMSMLTGLDPDAHGLNYGRSLSPAVWTLAERLRDAGYRTAGMVDDCYFLDRSFGYGAGFDLYVSDKHDAARRSTDAVRWLLKDERPAFLFLHLYDPHSDRGTLPYGAPAQYRKKFAPEVGDGFVSWVEEGGASETLRAVNERRLSLPDSLIPQLVDLYDAGLAATDAALGRMLAALQRAGRLRNAVVLILADHGESLGERGYFLHDEMMEATLHIPFLLHWPGDAQAGTVRDDLAETVDIVPTFLRAAGLEANAVGQGYDLSRPPSPPRKAVLSRSGLEYALTTDDGWRICYTWEDGGPRFTALRRVNGDPADGPDVLSSSPEVVASWVAWIRERHRADELLAARFGGKVLQMSDADEKLIHSLGYIN